MSTQAMHHTLLTDLRTARVTGLAGPWYYLGHFGDNSVPADRALCAASCLLQPEEGDLVLYSAPQPLPVMTGASPAGHRASYIVAVLARAESNAGRLRLPGGAAIESADGNMRLVGDQLGLNGRREIAVDTPALNVRSVIARLRASGLDATSTSIRVTFGTLNMMGSRITATCGRVWQTMQDSFRQVAGVDDTRAGRVRWQVAQQAHVQARHVTLLADEHVKIDGARLDLG